MSLVRSDGIIYATGLTFTYTPEPNPGARVSGGPPGYPQPQGDPQGQGSMLGAPQEPHPHAMAPHTPHTPHPNAFHAQGGL